MNHKRGRARNRRAGCKMCKPWKVNGVRTEAAVGEAFSDHRRRIAVPTPGENENELDLPRDRTERLGFERWIGDWELV